MTVNLDRLIFFDCFSKRAHLRRPGQLIRSTRGADQGSVDRQDHGRESCVSRHARAGPYARRAGALARALAGRFRPTPGVPLDPSTNTNSDRGGLTDVKSIALPQLSNADSAEAVEVEAKRSVIRPYPTGSRSREMSGDQLWSACRGGAVVAPAPPLLRR